MSHVTPVVVETNPIDLVIRLRPMRRNPDDDAIVMDAAITQSLIKTLTEALDMLTQAAEAQARMEEIPF